MGLLDDLTNPTLLGRKQNNFCTVCVLLTELPDSERDALDNALKNDKVASRALARVLIANGHKITDSTLARHRRGECVGISR